MTILEIAKEICKAKKHKLIRVQGHELISERPDGSISMTTINLEPTMTQQQYKDQCDVNLIMDTYVKTGELTHLARQQGVYADLTKIPDFQTSLNQVIQAKEGFMTLDARIRSKFDNDPAKLIQFLQDEKNFDEAVKLGLFEPKPLPSQPQTPPSTPPPSST